MVVNVRACSIYGVAGCPTMNLFFHQINRHQKMINSPFPFPFPCIALRLQKTDPGMAPASPARMRGPRWASRAVSPTSARPEDVHFGRFTPRRQEAGRDVVEPEYGGFVKNRVSISKITQMTFFSHAQPSPSHHIGYLWGVPFLCSLPILARYRLCGKVHRLFRLSPPLFM